MASQAEVRAVDNAIEADPAAGSWWNAWERLKAVADDLDGAAAALEAQRDFALARPELRVEFSARAGALAAARSRLVWVRDAIRSTLGLFGVQLEGLGALPLIPIAVVLATVAYLAKLAADTWAFARRLEEQRRLEAEGVPPAEAAKIAAQTTGLISSPFGGLVPIAVIGAIGIAALLYMRSRRQ